MKRRDIVVGVIAGVAATALVFEARAQQPGRTYRIALLALFRPQRGRLLLIGRTKRIDS
jgi:hypothetical protein